MSFKINFKLLFIAILALKNHANAEIAPPLPTPLIQPTQARAEFTVAGHHLVLQNQNSDCVLQVGLQNSDHVASVRSGRQFNEIAVGLQAPCYFLIWQNNPPLTQNRKQHIAQPIGSQGEPMAWRYSSAQNVAVLAIIGDPLPKPQAEPQNQAQGKLRCGSSIRALLLYEDRVELLSRERHTGRFCVESGADEKLFWILAHPRKPPAR